MAFEPLEARRLLAVLTVNSTADIVALDGLVTLREAIVAANTDTVTELMEVGNGADEIRFDPSLFGAGPATILLEIGELSVTSALTVIGPGANLLTIDASGNDPTPGSTLDDGNNANDLDGSRVLNIDDGDSATHFMVVISELTITGGDSNGFGGGILNREDLTLSACRVTDNVADAGGGIANFDRLAVFQSTISGNQARNAGGAINSRSYLLVTGSTISGNSARFFGGGVYSLDGLALIQTTTISGNRSEQSSTGAGGGGLANRDGSMTVTGSRIIDNVTNGSGTSAIGGGIVNWFGTLTVTASTVSGNAAGGSGGGVYSPGDMAIDSSTISGNTSGLDGGGVFSGFYDLSLANSTISGNRAARRGGGVLLVTYHNTATRIAHTTITGNTADDDDIGSGGGMFVWGNGLLDIEHAIVAGNIDKSGAAPDLDLTTSPPLAADVRYSLVGDNTGSGLDEAPLGSPDDGGNLIGNADGGGVIDPRLDALADYGGPTLTHRLRGNSPAIDAGDPSAVAGQAGVPPQDQRGHGFPRILVGRIDIGAFELANNDPLLTPAAAQTVNEGTPLALAALATFTDADAFDTHTATIDWGDGSPLEDGVVDEGLLRVGGSHTYADHGVYTVVVTMFDNRGGSGSAMLQVTVDNVVPTLTGTAGLTVDEGQPKVEPGAELPVGILPSLLLTIGPDPPPPLPESDGGAGGGAPPPELEEPRASAIRDQGVFQAVYYRPRVVHQEEVVDAVFSLGDVELVSLLGVDMGDDPVFKAQKKATPAEADVPVAVPAPTLPPIAPVPMPELPAEPSWNSLAFWVALAGSGTLWLSGTWWWMRRGRKMPRR